MHLNCPVCHQTNRLQPMSGDWRAECGRCGEHLLSKTASGTRNCLIFSTAALAFYIPANLLPIISMDKFGVHSETTIWSGCAALLADGYVGIAALVFIASIAVPLVKILSLFYLSLSKPGRGNPLHKLRLYRIVHTIGPWSMLDVFLVAVLVALVKLGDLAQVQAQPGLVAFAMLVVMTLLASASFSPSRLWPQAQEFAHE